METLQNGASAQNNEITNEQATAQVSNQTNNDEMKDIDNPSAAASGVMTETAGDSRNESTKTTNNNINSNTNTNMNTTASNNQSVIANQVNKLSELIAMGYDFCFIRGEQQRDLKKIHIDTLIESFKRCGNTILTPIEVVTAEHTVREGLSLERLSIDDKGKFTFSPIAIDENIDKLLTIVDGQHRFAAYLKASKIEKIDVNVEVRTLELGSMSVANFLSEKNFNQLAWSHKDMVNATNAKFADKGETLMSVAQEWMREYSVTAREAFKILSFKDCYNKKLFSDSFNSDNLDKTLVGNPKQIERGKKIFEALRHGFVNQTKSLKNSEAIDAIISVYDNADDTEKATVVDELILFFTTINDKLDLDNPFDKDDYLALWDTFKTEIANPFKLAEYQTKATAIMATDGILSKTEDANRKKASESNIEKASKTKENTAKKVSKTQVKLNKLNKQVTEAKAALKEAQKADNDAQARLEKLQGLSHSTQAVASGIDTQSDDKTPNVA